jgi:hypothetical protein
VRIALGLALDAAVICPFAAIGRRNHGESSALLGLASTAWPFLAGMAAGLAASLLAVHRAPLQVRSSDLPAIAAIYAGWVQTSTATFDLEEPPLSTWQAKRC